jgi:hypothetical protein
VRLYAVLLHGDESEVCSRGDAKRRLRAETELWRQKGVQSVASRIPDSSEPTNIEKLQSQSEDSCELSVCGQIASCEFAHHHSRTESSHRRSSSVPSCSLPGTR